MNTILFSFAGFMLLFALIGGLSYLKAEKTAEDYLIANRSVSPWLAGLSAVATNNSGYMFIGMIGLTYATGLSSIWLMIGWIAGDMLASYTIMPQLRRTAEKQDLHSFGGLLADWHGGDYSRLRRLSGLLVIVFLGTYAAAQFNAGGKALQVLLGWQAQSGALLGAMLVLFYSFMGGIRASIWTDAAQSMVMIASMVFIMVAGLFQFGSPAELVDQLTAVDPDYMEWFPTSDATGILLFVAGWFFAGFGVAGQPHIVVRYMALDRVQHLGRFRFWYYGWFVLFYAATIGAGLLTRLLLPEIGGFDAELALPTLAGQLLPGAMVGLMLAGLFAATMSTADSLIISCAASFSRDLFPHHKQGYWQTKLIAVGVICLALMVSLYADESVFRLVLIAWGLLASAFAPLLFIYARGGRPSEPLALAVVIGGVAAFLAWRWAGLSSVVYEILPGMLVGLLVFGLWHAIINGNDRDK